MKAMRLLSLLLLLGIVPAFAQSSQQPALPDLQTAGQLGAELFQRSGKTGMVMVVVRDKQVFFRGYGETAPGSHQTPTADSVVRICSLTKIFTTDLLTKLAADKTVSLGDPLQRYAPAHHLVPKRNQVITLEDLATHTAGLPRELGAAPRHTPHFTYPDYATRWKWLPRQQLATTPGKVAVYSNIGFDLLGDALQSAAHKPLAALLSERTLQPLKMYQTTYYPTAAQCARLLVGGWEQGDCTVTENTAGSSGLYSTPADMAIWLQYLLGTAAPAIPAQDPAAQAPYLKPEDLLRQTGLEHAGPPTAIGLGWLHLQPLDAPGHIIQKTGGGAGFTTYIALTPARHTALFVATTDGPKDSIAPGINLFKEANNLLLTLDGLPAIPDDEPKRHVKPAGRQRSEIRDKRAEIRNQRAEIREQRAEIRPRFLWRRPATPEADAGQAKICCAPCAQKSGKAHPSTCRQTGKEPGLIPPKASQLSTSRRFASKNAPHRALRLRREEARKLCVPLLIRQMNTVRNEPQVLHSPTPATKDLSLGTPVVQDDNLLATPFICRSYRGASKQQRYSSRA
jgi:D-alanyl-D-alanine-carboxypeptidase/D-alanyl-D-alanine-endopeptidase